MATCISVCAICNLQNQNIESTHWCIECEEPLCVDCKNHHNALKVTRNHKTISISEYNILPAVVTDIKHHCVYHNEIYQLYCIKHESPICNKCVKDHWKCGEILSLNEKVRGIKTSEYFVDLEQSLDDLFTNINILTKDRESNKESITIQKKKIAEQVSHLKKQVIQHVNKLEDDFMKELDNIELNCCNPIHLTVFSLKDKTKKINQLKSELQSTKRYASDLQSFLSMRKIQAKATEYEQYLQSSIEQRNQDNIKIESAINTKIQDILMVDTFGSIKLKTCLPIDIDLNRRKDRQAQMMVHKEEVLINDIKIVFNRKLDTAFKCLTGCRITKEGDFLFTNYENRNGKVAAVNAESKVKCTIQLTERYHAFDVAELDDSTLAISTGYCCHKCGISIVDLTQRKVIKTVDLPGVPFGITFDGKSLICCVKDKDLHVIACADYRITIIPHTACQWYSYVATHADKIFFTNPENQTVTCCLYNGSLVWKFNDKSVLDCPRGISIDNSGHIFVAGMDSCNVVVISPDGKQCQQILTRADGLNEPTAMFFDKARKQLLVTNEMQFANVFNISYV